MSTVRNTADIVVVLDESGSMAQMGNEPIQALNMFIQEQQQSANGSLFSLYTFSNIIRPIYINKDLDSIQEYTDYHPNGFTALYDCILRAIEDKMRTERKNNVILLIITDGNNNSGKTTLNQVKDRINFQETEYNWQIIYLAANQDAFSVGETMNITRTRCGNYSQQNSGELVSLVRTVSETASSFRQLSQNNDFPSCINLQRG
jgi:Mg-chelatase subunit ChlD